MYVYRVENEGGKGPYNTGEALGERIMAKHNNNKEFPSVWNDIPKNYNEWRTYCCACPTLKELKAWFKGFWPELVKEGYYIAIYSVPEKHTIMGISKKQILFRKDKAKRMKRKA